MSTWSGVWAGDVGLRHAGTHSVQYGRPRMTTTLRHNASTYMSGHPSRRQIVYAQLRVMSIHGELRLGHPHDRTWASM